MSDKGEIAAAEIVHDMGAEQAYEIYERIFAHLEDAWRAIIATHTRRGWKVLGYESWDEFCDTALDPGEVRKSRTAAMVQSLHTIARDAQVWAESVEVDDVPGVGSIMAPAITALIAAAQTLQRRGVWVEASGR